ncbi:MAG: hypothetical protein M1825_005542 [Sarcosagium campestre]|nr:MAG: hypothetical protein M1825_005542 [Sarcosagium campestre]
MTELSFVKQFLTMLDSRPTRITSEHVEDPHKYPAKPAYILPKMARPMQQKQNLAPGQERSVGVSLKSARNPPLDLFLAAQPLATSVLEIKQILAGKTGLKSDKIRLLLNKKPCADSKSLKELLGGSEAATVDFTVMVIGWAAASLSEPEAAAPVAQGPSGADVLATDAFWSDLRGFLVQRLKDKDEGDKVLDLFKVAWERQAR